MDDVDAPRSRLMAAGRELFFLHGVAEVSIDALVRAAKVSKTTFYKRFSDKQALMAAIVTEECDRIDPKTRAAPTSFNEFRQALINFGSNLLLLLEGQDKQQFERAIIGQAHRDPETARVFYETAYGRTCTALRALLNHGADRQLARLDLPVPILADWLVDLWKGRRHAERQLGLAKPIPTEVLRDHVAVVVDYFIHRP